MRYERKITMYCAFITRIKDMRKHSNADRLQCGLCFGNNVIVSLDVQEGELGVYFPVDGRLGIEYCKENNLLRKKDDAGNNIGGFLEEGKQKIQALKLRGEQSDGLFMPLKSLERFTDVSTLKEGDQITILDGVKICEKYIPRGKPKGQGTQPRKKKVETESFPIFFEHSDTSQLCYNTAQFREGDQCTITLKMHGTSQRTTHTIKRTAFSGWLAKILKPRQKWEHISGTRRVVLKNMEGGFYGNNSFRQQHHDKFVGKLQKGETMYYEVVGFVGENSPIMGDCNNKKIKDDAFIRQYGDTTRFSYGCEDGESETYVYRMTMTNEDGYVVEYPWDLVKLRCEQMGVNFTPELEKFNFTTVDDLMARVAKHEDGPDPIGNHIREGVIVRIENREKFTAYKHKNWNFKVIEGIIKDAADAPDIEEAQEVE
jgi:hypothetical protein